MSQQELIKYNFNFDKNNSNSNSNSNSIDKKSLLISLLEYVLQSNEEQAKKLFDDIYHYLEQKNSKDLIVSKDNLLTIYNSRYNNDFVESEIINKGGFGLVCRALNKLDNMEYAI